MLGMSSHVHRSPSSAFNLMHYNCRGQRLDKLSKISTKTIIAVEGVESKHSTKLNHQENMISSSILNDPMTSCFRASLNTKTMVKKKIYKTELTNTRYNNQVLGKYRVDPQRAGLTLIAELTWSNIGLKRVLNERI